MAALRQRTSKAVLSVAESRPCTCARPPPRSYPSSPVRYTTSARRHPTLSSRPQLSPPARPSPVLTLSPPRRLLATHTTRPGPTSAYNELVASGLIRDDEHQRSIVSRLQRMHDDLEAYDPPDIPDGTDQPTSFFSKLFASKTSVPTIPPNVPKGLYLFGSVGCGKSFLMDLFYANLPAKFADSKRRVHFHAFMMDVHQRGHRLKGQLDMEQDWIVHVAQELARDARVLCFDEFQVTDIADAMILRRLMESMMGYGVVCVMTSNRPPDDLYKNGIQREQFVPCIELIKHRFHVQSLDSAIDYRKIPRALSKVYFHPMTPENSIEISKIFDALTDEEELLSHRPLTVWGRQINVPLSTSKVAKFSFDELCGHPLSASDYLEITKNFETIFLTDVPLLTLDLKDVARRFILFIDAAYEAKTKLFVLSDPPIHSVFSDKKSTWSHGISDHQRSVMDDLGLSADTVGASSIFTGEEEVFAFARAVSRLTEMGSVQWAQAGRTTPVVEGKPSEELLRA